MLEKEIETKVCNYARDRGMMAHKYKTPARRNAPDRIFLCDGGYHFFIEFKREGAKPNGGQLREHRRLREKGHAVYVCDNVNFGKQIIDHWLAFLRAAAQIPTPGTVLLS